MAQQPTQDEINEAIEHFMVNGWKSHEEVITIAKELCARGATKENLVNAFDKALGKVRISQDHIIGAWDYLRYGTFYELWKQGIINDA